MLTLFISNHSHRIVQAASTTPPNIKEIIGTSIGMTAGVIGIIAMIVYIWADYKDNKELDAMLQKNGIDVKKTKI